MDEQLLRVSYHLCKNPLMNKLLFRDDNCRVHQTEIFSVWFDAHSKVLFHIPCPAMYPDLKIIKYM